MTRLALGDIVEIHHDSILDGMGAVVLADDGTTVWVATGPIVAPSTWPCRHVLPREAVKPVDAMNPRKVQS